MTSARPAHLACAVLFAATAASAQALDASSVGKAIAPAPVRSLLSEPVVLPDAPTPTVRTADGSASAVDSSSATVSGTPRRVVLDEWSIVRSPAHLRKEDLKWLLPLAGATAVSFATDERVQTEVVSSNPSFNQTSINLSDGLVGGMIAAPAVLFLAGSAHHDEHARETGVLGGEAMADAYIAGELIKLCTFRERPTADNSEGSFFRTSAGLDSSFASQHSLVAWSSAAVLSAAYPNAWVQTGAYTAAAGVSLTRVMGREHFPSDVLLGSAAGWLIGHYIYQAQHRTQSLRDHARRHSPAAKYPEAPGVPTHPQRRWR